MNIMGWEISLETERSFIGQPITITSKNIGKINGILTSISEEFGEISINGKAYYTNILGNVREEILYRRDPINNQIYIEVVTNA